HYVFYLWRRVLDRTPTARYALAPAFAAAWALLLSGLRRRASRLWLLGFLACLVAQLLPAWLLELRYFTPGLYLAALRLEPPTRLQAAIMLAAFAAVNAVTMYLFLRRPYTFADGSVARFMW
ncbi:putative Dol-P-Glc:Glc(2)Man(9)GlcNAc(2)-PP-Dol alpha-1,2-glucosyltransferase, partial [Tetrabaena socialis]